MSRTIEIQNDIVLKSLERKAKLTEELKQLAKDEEKLQAKGNKLMAKLTKENEKVMPIMLEVKDTIEIGPFEQVSRTYLGEEGDEKGKLMVEISDRLEEFHINWKKENEENNSSDSNEGDGDGGANAEESTEGDKDNTN